MGLTAKQEEFAQELANTLSPGKAAEAAGYNPSYGYELADKPKIVERVKHLRTHSLIAMTGSRNEVMREVIALSTSDITKVLQCITLQDLQELPEMVRRAIRKIVRTARVVSNDIDEDGFTRTVTEEKLTIEMHPKVEPLRLYAQIMGMLEDVAQGDKGKDWTGFVLKAPPEGK